MHDLVVHGIPGRSCGRAVLVALEETGAHQRLAPVAGGGLRRAARLRRGRRRRQAGDRCPGRA